MGGHCVIGAGMAKGIGSRLRLRRQQSQQLSFLVRNHMRIADFPKMGRGKQIRFLSEGEVPKASTPVTRYPLFFDLLQVMVADCESCAHRSKGWAPVLSEVIRVVDHIERVCGLQRAREMIDGHDLVNLGFAPGPRLGEVLNHVHDRILAGHIETRESAIACAKSAVDEVSPLSDENYGLN